MKQTFLNIPFFAIFFSFFVFSSVFSLSKEPGDQIEDFTLTSVDGSTYNLDETLIKSQYVVLMFWSTECPYVQPYTDRINSIADDYSSKGIAFWGVNANSTESYEEVKSHAEQKGYVFPMLKDENNVIADMLGATKTPEVYVIDRNKTILYHGSIDDNRDAAKVTTNHLRNSLDEMLAGKDVSVNNTKFFGCTIKRAGK